MPCGTAHHIRPGPGEVLARAGVVDRRRPRSGRGSTRCAGPAPGCRSGYRAGRDRPGRPAPASSRGTPPCRAMVRAGSASSAATASSTAPPGDDLVGDPAHLATRAGPARGSPRRTSRPGRSGRRGSTARPARSARARRPGSRGPGRRSSSRRNRPKSAVASVRGGGAAGRAPRAARRAGRWRPAPAGPGPGRSRRRRDRSRSSHCLATSRICCRGGDVARRRRPPISVRPELGRARAGTAPSRAATSPAACSPSSGIRSNTDRDAVQAAGDDVQLAGHVARVVAREGQLEPLDHRLLGDPLGLVGRFDRWRARRGCGGRGRRGRRGPPATGRSARGRVR